MTTAFAVLEFAGKLPALFRRARADVVRRLDRSGAPPAPLRGLSPAAKSLLRQLLQEDRRTLRTPRLAEVAIGLELREIIAIYRDPAPDAGGFVLTLNDWAVEPLRRHPDLLQG